MTAALDVRDLSVGYLRGDGGVNKVVWNVSLELRPGEILGLAGESGCGKSTTALAAIGYRSPGTRILGGQSLMGDVDLLALPSSKLRRLWGGSIAYVAQSASTALNPALPVGKQLAEVLRRHTDLRGRELRARQVELFEGVNLPDPERALQRFPHQFSGGQQQRIAIAIALSCRPKVLLLDEPTTGLDVTTQARITTLLRSLLADSGVAALYVSHDLTLLATIADRLAVMYAGQVVEDGPAADFVRRPAHPYTRALLSAVPDAHRPHAVSGIPGRPPATVDEEGCPFSPRCAHAIPKCRGGNPELLPVDGRVCRCVRVHELELLPLEPRPLVTAKAIAEEPLLVARDVRCEYRSGRRVNEVVKGVSLDVAPGETVGIVGESGSGKSTFLRAIAGLHRPSSGTIAFEGAPLQPLAVQRPRALRRDIQLVFQNPDSSLNPRHTVANIVFRPIVLFRDELRGAARREEVRHLLDAVKLPPSVLHRYPSELSGGQKQRIALARAFAARPKLLLCDEVSSALDVSVQATILELIAQLAVDFRTAVIFVSHDLGVVRTVASRALVMRLGEVCEAGPTDRLFAEPSHPYTRDLLAAIPDPVAEVT